MLCLHSKQQPDISCFIEPLSGFRAELLARIQPELLAPTDDFSLKGLDAYWRSEGSGRTATSFQQGALQLISQVLRALPDHGSAGTVLEALHARARYSHRAGPEWMEAESFNHLLWKACAVVNALVQEYQDAAQANAPQTVAQSQAVQHQLTHAFGVVQDNRLFDRQGLVYAVLSQSHPAFEHWPADAVQTVH